MIPLRNDRTREDWEQKMNCVQVQGFYMHRSLLARQYKLGFLISCQTHKMRQNGQRLESNSTSGSRQQGPCQNNGKGRNWQTALMELQVFFL